jgi:hypothetical protein
MISRIFSAPFVWLDVIVLLCFGCGIVWGILTLSLEPSRQRGFRKLISTIFLGASFVLGGADQLMTHGFAPRASADGVISFFKVHGRDSRTDFVITDDQGNLLRLTGNFSGSELAIGEHVHIEWMMFNSQIVRMQISSGSGKGLRLQDVVSLSALSSITLGIWLVSIGYRKWQKDSDGNHEKSKGVDPPSGIDEHSLIHLN